MRRMFNRKVGFIAALVMCAGGVALALIMIMGREPAPEEFKTRGFFLAGLAMVNLLIFVALVFVLFRQLVKGYLEWRRQREGARFRTRLLTAFVLLGLLPSLLLFIGAIQVIESAVDQWFRFPVQGTSTAGQRLVDNSLDLIRDQTLRKAKALVWQLQQVPTELRPSLASHLFAAGDMDSLWVVDRAGAVLEGMPDREIKLDSYHTAKLFQQGSMRGWLDLSKKPRIVSGVVMDDGRAVLIAALLPMELFSEAQSIADNNKQYLQARSMRISFKVTMISSFLLLTLLVTFVAVWIGMHLSKEISVPLAMLLEGTREVSKGNLTHAVEYGAKDEIGIVVASFNNMISELAASKRDLELSNSELRMTTLSAERRRRYIEALLETLNIGVVHLDAGGEVHTINPKARQILGIDRTEAARNLLSLPSWRTVKEALPAARSHPVQNVEVALSGPDGQSMLSVSTTTLREPEGSVFGTLYILEDITGLSKAQRIAAWQEVARRMAHEIKNPLTPIRLSAQRIRKKFKEKAPDLEEVVLQGTTTIEREVEGMLTIVNEFSRFARLPEVHMRLGQLPPMLKEIVEAYRATYPKVSFEVSCPENFPPLRFDHEQLGRVFKNLIENSLEAMKMSGALSVTLAEAQGQALCTVRDTGPGFSPEARSRLFLPYYSTKRKGTGLGLAIAARVIEEHGGSIRIDEHYSGGAGFIITLPVAPA